MILFDYAVYSEQRKRLYYVIGAEVLIAEDGAYYPKHPIKIQKGQIFVRGDVYEDENSLL